MNKLSTHTQVAFLGMLVIAAMMLLRSFLVPLAYGLLIALIMYPICRTLERKRIRSGLAILISMLAVVSVFAFLVFVFLLQVKVLRQELPALLGRISLSFPAMQDWISETTGLSLMRQELLLTDIESSISSNAGSLISASLSLLLNAGFNLIVIPLYAVLILVYRRSLVDFLVTVAGEKYKATLPGILNDTIGMYFNYIKGMGMVYLVVGVLNSIGLLILGVDYAIIFGMVSAFMTIIPYVGIIISAILPMSLVWAETDNILYPIGVAAVFTFVQYLEANMIFPYIVGKQIGINMLVTIIGIFFGGAIWGVSGMVLVLPFIAILKIVSSHIESLSPLSRLLDERK